MLGGFSVTKQSAVPVHVYSMKTVIVSRELIESLTPAVLHSLLESALSATGEPLPFTVYDDGVT